MIFFHKNDSKAFENYRLCHSCGGACCKSAPCILHESDMLDKDPNFMYDQIKEKNLQIRTLVHPDIYRLIGYYEFPYFYLSSASIYSPRVNYLDLSGRCANLTMKGCNFSSKERPMGGRLLVPNKDLKCRYENPDQVYELIYSWMNFQSELVATAELFTHANIGEEVSLLYQRVCENYDSLVEDGTFAKNTDNFILSYQYIELVKEYGLKLSPRVLFLINDYCKKYPSRREGIISIAGSIDNIENKSDDAIKRNLNRKLNIEKR